MAKNSRFVRRPDESNEDIVVSRCALCRAFVGAAPSQLILKIMEDAHICRTQQRRKTAEEYRQKSKRT